MKWRTILARAPLPMLALAASWGVYEFSSLFAPFWVALIQAAAFEMTYIGLAITQGFDPAQRKRATMISVGAVAASIIYNTLAGWFHAQPQLLAGAGAIAWLCLAILHGAPLAWVAFLVADLLLHSATVAVAAVTSEATAATPQTERVPIAVAPDKFAAYLPILAAFDRDPRATTADLATAANVSARTAESRRSELIKMGVLHKTDAGYVRNGVELTAL